MKNKDQESPTAEAYQLLLQTIQSNPHVEGNVWGKACLKVLLRGYLYSGISYEQFSLDTERWKEHYKRMARQVTEAQKGEK